jgi:hypothetical protein
MKSMLSLFVCIICMYYLYDCKTRPRGKKFSASSFRKADGFAQGGENNHADHHAFHNKNFSIYNITLDLLFGTAVDSRFGVLGKFRIEREEVENKINLRFTRASNPVHVKASLKQ